MIRFPHIPPPAPVPLDALELIGLLVHVQNRLNLARGITRQGVCLSLRIGGKAVKTRKGVEELFAAFDSLRLFWNATAIAALEKP